MKRKFIILFIGTILLVSCGTNKDTSDKYAESVQEIVTRLESNPKNIEYADTYTGIKQDPSESDAETFVDFKMLEMDDGIDELVCWWGSSETNSITVSVYKWNGDQYKISATMNFSHGDPTVNSGGEYFVQQNGIYNILSWSSHNNWLKSYSVFTYAGDRFEELGGYNYARVFNDSGEAVYNLYKFNAGTQSDELVISDSNNNDNDNTALNQYLDNMNKARENAIEIKRK